jgi:hypothetical protein
MSKVGRWLLVQPVVETLGRSFLVFPTLGLGSSGQRPRGPDFWDKLRAELARTDVASVEAFDRE